MNTGGLLGGRGVAENTYQVQTTSVFLSRNVLANGRVRKAETIFTYVKVAVNLKQLAILDEISQ